MTTLNQAAPAAPYVRSDASHWYCCENNQWFPLYSAEKNYTLREARKDKEAGKIVVPSVTTIFKKLAKDALTDWKVEQAIRATLENPVGMNEPTDEWVDRVAAIADNSSRGAMDLGTAIHTAVEQALAGQDYAAGMDVYVKPVMLQLERDGLLGGVSEACVGSTQYGYAGRCDLNHESSMTVADFKSRKSNKNKTPSVPSYSTDAMQLAAYGYALWGSRFFAHGKGIIYGISTSRPGELTPHVFTGQELNEAFNAFIGLTRVWIYESNFDPRIST